MQLRQLFIAAAALTQGLVPLVQANPIPQPWGLVQWSAFEGSSALIANPNLTQGALNIVKNAPGFVRGYFGRQFENPNIFSLAFEWTSLSAQRNFERSRKGRQVAAILKTATANGEVPSSEHLPFVSDYTIAFNAPATEVVQATLRDGKTPDDLITAVANAYTGALNAAPGIIIPASRAEVLEKPRSFFLTGGWEHVQDHINAVSTEPAISLIAAVAATVKPDYSITHIIYNQIV